MRLLPFQRRLIPLCVCSLLLSLTACENRASIEPSKTAITELVASPAVKYGWTTSGLAKAYLTEGLKVERREQTLWRLHQLTVVAGPIDHSFRPKKLTPHIVPASSKVKWDASFEQVELVVPLRVQSDKGTYLCRFKMSSPLLDVTTIVSLVPQLGHGGNKLKLAGTPTVSNASWTLTPLGECDTSLFPSTFDYELELRTYLNDAFIHSLGSIFESFPRGPFNLLAGTIKVSSLSSYDSRHGAMYVTPDLDELRISLFDKGVEISLPVKLGNKRAKCVPSLALNSVVSLPPLVGADPVDLADKNGVDFNVILDATFINYLFAAYTRTGLACTGFESADPAQYEYGSIATETLDLPQIGFTGLPFGELSTLVFSPNSLPSLTFRPAARQFSMTFERVSIDLYTELFGVYTRLASYNFKLRFDIQLGIRQKLISHDIIKVDVADSTTVRSIGPVIPAETLNQWLRRAIVLLTSRGQLPQSFLNSTPYQWKGVELESNALRLFGNL